MLRRSLPTPRDHGAMSVEMTALVFPATVLAIMLIVGVWQLSVARLDVSTAAGAAARAASLQTSPAQAEVAAYDAAGTALADNGRTCQTLKVEVDTARFRHGGQVTVTVECAVSTGDLIGLPAPATVPTRATASAPVDSHVELQIEELP